MMNVIESKEVSKETSEFAKRAMEYYEKGYKVIPMEEPVPGDKSTGKRPVIKDWSNANITPDYFYMHWVHKSCNIGLLMGEPSRLVALDFDKGEAFLKWKEEHPEVAEKSYVVKRDPSIDRCHVYFKLPEGAKAPKSISKHEEGWELKSTGTVLTASPSIHYTGGKYDVVQGTEPLPWDDAYLPSQATTALAVRKTADLVQYHEKADIMEIMGLMSKLPKGMADNYDSWLKVGIILHNELGDKGLDLWKSWSQTSEKYEEGICEEKWESFEGYEGEPLTVGTLIRLSKESSGVSTVKAVVTDVLVSGDNHWQNSPSYKHLTEEGLEPCVKRDSGAIMLNDIFWAKKVILDRSIKYLEMEGFFISYNKDTGIWGNISEEEIKKEFVSQLIAGDHALDAKGKIKTQIDAWLLRGLLALMKTLASGDFDAPDELRFLIPTKNYVIELFMDSPEIKLQEHSPDWHIRRRIEHNFNPDAKCEDFINDILKTQLNEEDIIVLQKLFGSVLLGRNITQVLPIFQGTGGGGKSLIVSIFENMIGKENVHELRTSHLDGRFETSMFRNKTLLTGKDVDENFLQESGAAHLKKLTGGDLMSCEYKGLNKSSQIKGNFNVFITANSRLKLKISGDASAWRRRIIFFEFTKGEPVKVLRDLDKDLVRREGEGILAWGVKGAQMLLDDVKATGKIALSEAQKGRVISFLNESDSVNIFVESKVIQESGKDITGNELLSRYSEFCNNNNWIAYSRVRFDKIIQDVILNNFNITQSHDIKRDGKSQRGYKNLTIKA